MANYGSRVRRAQSAYTASRKLAANEVKLQKMYVNTFATFDNYAKGIGSPATTGRVTPSGPRGGWTRQDRLNKVSESERYQPYDSFTFYRPEDLIKSQGGSTSVKRFGGFTMDKFIHYSATTKKKKQSVYRGIADTYKDRAISAEMGGIAAANLAVSNLSKPLDTSYIGSARGGMRNSAAAASKSKQRKAEVKAATANALRQTGTATTSSAWLKSIQAGPQTSSDFTQAARDKIQAGLNATAIGALTGQAAYDYAAAYSTSSSTSSSPASTIASIYDSIGSNGIPGWDGPVADNFFNTKRDASGQVKKHNASDYLTPRKATQEEKNFLTTTILNSEMATLLPAQIQKQQKEEDMLEKQLKGATEQLEAFKFFPTEVYDKTTGKTTTVNKKQYDAYGNQMWRVTEKSQDLESEISMLNTKLQDINNDQAVVEKALKTTNRNDIMRYLAKHDVVTDEKRLQYVQSSNPDRKVLEQEVAAAGYAHEQATFDVSAISSDIRELDNLQKNNIGGKNQDKIENFVWGLELKYGKDLDTIHDFDSGPDSTGASSVGNRKKQEVNINSLDELTNVDGIVHQLKNSVQAKALTVQSKKRKLQLDASMTLALDMTNEESVQRASGINKQAENKQEFEKLTGMKAGSNASSSMNEWYDSIGATRPDKQMDQYVARDTNRDWFQTWLTNDTVLTRDQDLTLWGDKDEGLRSDIQHKMNILKKYDSWGSANKYIGSSLSEWKGDLNTYYKSHYVAPNVSKATAAKSWLGSSTIQGDSFVGEVLQEMGGIRGGAYWTQDVKKLNIKTRAHEKTIKGKLETKRKTLIDLRSEQAELKASHDALRPQISAAVDKGTKFGDISYDDALAKTLTSSSQSLYDKNYEVALKDVEIEYLEKSLVKTEKERKDLEKQRQRREYEQVGGTVHNVSLRGVQSRSARPSLKSFSRRNTGGGGQKKTRGGQSTLGGLVI